jgi:hypothetical protein
MRVNIYAVSLLAVHFGFAHSAPTAAPGAPQATASSAEKKPSADKRRHARHAQSEKTFEPVLWDQLDADRLGRRDNNRTEPAFPAERR